MSGVQASLPDMTALLEQAEEEQAQILKEQKVYTAQTTDATTSVDDEVQSTNGIFIDLATGNILFDRDAHTRINPGVHDEGADCACCSRACDRLVGYL